MPIVWTEAHHVIPWARGGRTELGNLAPLCPYNHDQHEKQGWALVMVDGRPWWRPPAWIDPDRALVRNTAHHHDPLAGARTAGAELLDSGPTTLTASTLTASTLTASTATKSARRTPQHPIAEKRASISS
jgi:hypothetical protein